MIVQTIELVETATVRMIPTAFHRPPVLRPLIDTDEEERLLAAIEGLTSKRLKAQRSGLPSLDARELLYRAWGHTYVNAAFAYTRAEGNRFNDATRGAWYCALDDMTPLYEVAFHRTRELERVGRFVDEGIYVQLLAGFVGSFHEIESVEPTPDCLHPEPDVSYGLGQELARKLRAENSRGLLYPSVRHPGGRCLVAFEPSAVQNVRQGARWRLEWSGTPDWSATAL